MRLLVFCFLFICPLIASSQEDIGIISQMGNVGGGIIVPPNQGWVSQCATCPNASVTSNGNEYTPTSAADMTDPTSANKTAIISNSFDLTGVTIAANQIIVPAGGAITGTNINLNGASFVVNDQQAFSPNATFVSRYAGCISPETFGAGSASNDEPAIQAALILADYVYNSPSAVYTITSGEVAIPDASRTIRWIGNNSKVEVLASAEATNTYIADFGTNRMEICNIEFDGNDVADFGLRFTSVDFYLEGVWIHNLYRVSNGPGVFNSSWGIWQENFDIDTCRDTRIYNCKINNINAANDGVFANGDGSTRGFYTNITDLSNTSLQASTIWEMRDTEIYNIFSEGDGVHIQGPATLSGQEHNVLWIFDNCDMYDNSRRDIKMQTSGARITNSRFGKISPLNPNKLSYVAPSGNVGLSLLDDFVPGANAINFYVADNVFYYRSPAQPPEDLGDFALAVTRSENAIVERNVFQKPMTWAANPLLFGKYNHNCIVRNNTFENGGIVFADATVASSPAIQVFNNTFSINTFGPGYETAIIHNPGADNQTHSGLNFYDNTVSVDFSGSNTSRWRGIIGNRSGDNTTWQNITINSNDITFTGANRTGQPFCDISGNFGSTNTISNHVVTGITATNAFQITGTKNFTNTNNTDESSNPLTVQ